MKTLNVGIIGLGRMGQLHLMNCSKIDGVKVVATADSSKKALKKAQSNGVKKLYTDYHELFNHSSDMDAVVISLPNFLHVESIQLALERGLNVFVEKPLANTTKECHEIVRSIKRSGRILMVGHCMRFIDAIEKMKGILDKGYIGNLKVAMLEEVINGPFAHPRVPSPVSEWWFDPEKSGGGALLDIGYHMIDLFRFFAGESKVLFSHLDYEFNLPVEESALVILRSCNSNAKGLINVGWYEKTIFPKFDFRAILHGTSGYLSSDYMVPHNLYLHAVKEGIKNVLKKATGQKIRPLTYTYYYEPFYKEMAHFIDCIRRDLDPPVSAIDGLKTVELVEKAYKISSKNHPLAREN